MDMDHADVTVYEHIDEIREFIKPNEELMRRLDAVERVITRLRDKEDTYDWLSGEVSRIVERNYHLQNVVDRNSDGYK